MDKINKQLYFCLLITAVLVNRVNTRTAAIIFGQKRLQTAGFNIVTDQKV